MAGLFRRIIAFSSRYNNGSINIRRNGSISGGSSSSNVSRSSVNNIHINQNPFICRYFPPSENQKRLKRAGKWFVLTWFAMDVVVIAKDFLKDVPDAPVAPVEGQDILSNEENEKSTPDQEEYNLADFPLDYADAKFFIIRSYSEDDIHKSIKYKAWASTPNDNQKLDAAYQEAQAKPSHSPIFLLFSVNTSDQFVGLAEMEGPVDFNKNLEYWEQDKWTGLFPVKWHIVKDVPKTLLSHIILEKNENKPVTNSRDTQEVKLEQGVQVLKIFKEHTSKTSILDDFGLYETRQKAIQEKKAKKQQFQKQVLEGKTTDEKAKVKTSNGELVSQEVSANGCAEEALSGDAAPNGTKLV